MLCRYHGRRFTLAGRFHSMPEFEATANFPSKADDLPRVALERLERVLMVALAPAMPFDDVAAPMRPRLPGAVPASRVRRRSRAPVPPASEPGPLRRPLPPTAP